MITNERRTAIALAAIALCVLAVATAAAATTWTDDHAPMSQIVGTDGDDAPAQGGPAIDWGLAETGLGSAEGKGVQWQAMQQETTSSDWTRSQLLGAALVLAVLAAVGAAVWGVRPALSDVFGRATAWRGRSDDGSDGSSDEILLTDEERIIDLLEANGGRLKQQHVVETTDWSKAKVSRLLSSMEDDDAIVRIQLGREKLIFLSGHEPSGVRSTLGEDR